MEPSRAIYSSRSPNDLNVSSLRNIYILVEICANLFIGISRCPPPFNLFTLRTHYYASSIVQLWKYTSIKQYCIYCVRFDRLTCAIGQRRQEKASSFADHVHDGGKEFCRKRRNATFTHQRFGGHVQHFG